MLAEAPNNKGKPKKDWKPPVGYKSALGKARDAARAEEAKKKGTVASMVAPKARRQEEDTASEDDDGEYSQVGRSFQICALRLPRTAANQKPETHNQFVSFEDTEQEYDPETIAAFNNWAHHVNVVSKAPKKNKKSKKPSSPPPQSFAPHCDALPPGTGCDVPQDDVVVIKSSKDFDKYSHLIAAALPTEKKALAKTAKKIASLDVVCGPNEILALVDTGSFTHAVDADKVLPHHEILPVPKSEHRTAETACGGTLTMLGKVVTTGTVGGVRVGVTWSHMKVKCPILSIRCLVNDGHDTMIRKGGGVIRNVETGKEIPFFEHAGVYYLKMQIDQPATRNNEPLFSRLG